VNYRFDRILGILLFLRSGRPITASQLAAHFEVSTRTIHRDLKTLSAVGVPIYAERGRDGGFRLVEGYFLPPLMFSREEATALLLGLTLLRQLRARPFSAQLDTVKRKLLSALPRKESAALEDAEEVIGFETLPVDIFHQERPPHPQSPAELGVGVEAESRTISIFLQAIFDRVPVLLQYRSPYHDKTTERVVVPLGLLWDRDRWYLVGRPDDRQDGTRLWRADRVVELSMPARRGPITRQGEEFDVRTLMGRKWLQEAMDRWREGTPVIIRLTPPQAERLQRDWFYGHAHFAPGPDDTVVMSFGEDNREIVLELVRWLGPGAELLEPAEWRAGEREQLRQMLEQHVPVSEQKQIS